MKSKIFKTFLFTLIFFIVFFLYSACNDNIFYKISEEEQIKDPLIKGSPTNIVLFNGYIYVASGRTLYSYNQGNWYVNPIDAEVIEGMNIGQLAATDAHLYLFCIKNESGGLKRKLIMRDLAGTWAAAPVITGDFNILQTIYSANNKLFIGAQKSNDDEAAVHVIDANGVLKLEIITGKEESLLNGAAFNGVSVFLSTGSGIYLEDGTKVPNSSNRFYGIICLPDKKTVAAITRNGVLYMVETTGITQITNFPDSRSATGAIATWQEGSNYLLLLGRMDTQYTTATGHTFGYLELELSAEGGFSLKKNEENETVSSDKSFREPGRGEITTANDNNRYSTSIGIIPIHHIMQVPSDIDADMPLFASTQKKGLWSCRVRDGSKSWNAED